MWIFSHSVVSLVDILSVAITSQACLSFPPLHVVYEKKIEMPTAQNDHSRLRARPHTFEPVHHSGDGGRIETARHSNVHHHRQHVHDALLRRREAIKGTPYDCVDLDRWSFSNVLKLLTTFAFLVPATNMGHRVPWLNPVAWVVMTAACWMHHWHPGSPFWHDVDHWGAQISCALILVHMEGPEHWFVAFYCVLAAFSAFQFHWRMKVTAIGITWLAVFFADGYGFIAGIAAAASFVAQRKKLPHAHSFWHVAMAALGYLVTRPEMVRKSFEISL